MLMGALKVGGGGGGSVKNGKYEVTQSGETFTFDTGLGSSLKRVFVVCRLSATTSTNPRFNMSGWDADYPTKCFAGFTDNGRWLGQGVVNVTDALNNYGCKITDVTNGVVTVNVYTTTNYYLGNYYWYAE